MARNFFENNFSLAIIGNFTVKALLSSLKMLPAVYSENPVFSQALFRSYTGYGIGQEDLFVAWFFVSLVNGKRDLVNEKR